MERNIEIRIKASDLKEKLGIKDGVTPVKGVDYFDGKTPVKGEDYFDGKQGEDYILTEVDKQEIADSIEVPVVTKEIIHEQPIVTEVAIAESPTEIVEKLNTLTDKLDFKVLKNVPSWFLKKNAKGGSAGKSYALGGATTPGMPPQSIQYNKNGSFAGSSKLLFDDLLGRITIGDGTDTNVVTTQQSNNNSIYKLLAASNSGGQGPFYEGFRSRGTVLNPTVVADGDPLLLFFGLGHDGTNFQASGFGGVLVDGTPSPGIVPGKYVIQTANAAGVLTTGMTIKSDQSAIFASGLQTGKGILINTSSKTTLNYADALNGAAIFADSGTDFIIDIASSSGPNDAAFFLGNRARGTQLAKLAVQNGDLLSGFLAQGYDGSLTGLAGFMGYSCDGVPISGTGFIPSSFSVNLLSAGGALLQPIVARANGNVAFAAGIMYQYQGRTTAGMGLVPVYASYSTTGNTAAVTNAINYTPPAVAGRYRICGVVNVTSWATPASFSVIASYVDDSGVARTETAQVRRGSTGAAASAITAVDRWYFDFPLLAINNGAGAITLSTTGTFTGSPVYNLSATLEQPA